MRTQRFVSLIGLLFVICAAFGCSRHTARNNGGFNQPAYSAPAPYQQYADDGYNDLGYQPGAYGWFDGYPLGYDRFPVDDYGYHIPGYGPTPFRKIKRNVPGRIRVYRHNFGSGRHVYYYGNRPPHRQRNGQYRSMQRTYRAPSASNYPRPRYNNSYQSISRPSRSFSSSNAYRSSRSSGSRSSGSRSSGSSRR